MIRNSAGGPPSAGEPHWAWLELVDTDGPFLAVPALARVLLSTHARHLLSSVGRVPCMAKGMKLRDVNTALHRQSCHVISDRGDHTKWGCPCGHHSANIPRHTIVTPGVVRDTIRRLACLPEGWLQ